MRRAWFYRKRHYEASGVTDRRFGSAPKLGFCYWSCWDDRTPWVWNDRVLTLFWRLYIMCGAIDSMVNSEAFHQRHRWVWRNRHGWAIAVTWISADTREDGTA